jgi:hypothetical protein
MAIFFIWLRQIKLLRGQEVSALLGRYIKLILRLHHTGSIHGIVNGAKDMFDAMSLLG